MCAWLELKTLQCKAALRRTQGRVCLSETWRAMETRNWMTGACVWKIQCEPWTCADRTETWKSHHLPLPVILCSRIRATAAEKRTFSFNIYWEEKLGSLFSVKSTFFSISSNKDFPKLLSGASFVWQIITLQKKKELASVPCRNLWKQVMSQRLCNGPQVPCKLFN